MKIEREGERETEREKEREKARSINVGEERFNQTINELKYVFYNLLFVYVGI